MTMQKNEYATIENTLILENDGYDKYDIETILGYARALAKHIGFTDKRRDKRFVVKFHDIYYFSPDKYAEDADLQAQFDHTFSSFCDYIYEIVEDEMAAFADEHGYTLTTQNMLAHMYCGHYRAFTLDIPEITEDNIIKLATQVYDEFTYYGSEYIEMYIHCVDMLQNIEDTYMDMWLDYIQDDILPDACVREITRKYKRYKLTHKEKLIRRNNYGR